MNLKRRKILKSGEIYGDLTIIDDVPETKVIISKITGSKTVRALWKCRCICGKELKRTSTELTTQQRVRKCTDCAYKARPQSTLRCSNEERMYNLSIINRCKNSKGRIKNNLSLKEYSDIAKMNCHYCNKSPKLISHLGKNKIAKREDIELNGIDRIDSNLHYSKENCVPCCKNCNIMKGSLTVNDFFNHIKDIYNFNINRYKDENLKEK